MGSLLICTYVIGRLILQYVKRRQRENGNPISVNAENQSPKMDDSERTDFLAAKEELTAQSVGSAENVPEWLLLWFSEVSIPLFAEKFSHACLDHSAFSQRC